MIARIVPAIRLRRDTSSWSYRIPAGVSVQAGSLVSISFRGRPTPGVVWSVEAEDDEATESIGEILCGAPLVRRPQRALIEWLAEEGVCSLSSALFIWLPAPLRRLPLRAHARQVLAGLGNQISDAAEMVAGGQHCVLVPGRREAQEAQLERKFGATFARLSDFASEREELERWAAIARGDIRVGVGGERALFSPWRNLRHLTVVEPEDVAHYHESRPYLSLVDAAGALAKAANAELLHRTHLPTAAGERLWGRSLGCDEEPPIRIVDLVRKSLITDELVAAARETLGAGKDVLVLHNRKDALREETVDGRSQLKRVEGAETVMKKLAAALPEFDPRRVHVGTRAILARPRRNVGLTVALTVDHLLENPLFADQLHGWGDLGRLFSYGCPCIIQTHSSDHPMVWALAGGRFCSCKTNPAVSRHRHVKV